MLGVAGTLGWVGTTMAQGSQGQASPAAPADSWPRQVKLGGATAVVYQPQVDSWKGNTLECKDLPPLAQILIAVRPGPLVAWAEHLDDADQFPAQTIADLYVGLPFDIQGCQEAIGGGVDRGRQTNGGPAAPAQGTESFRETAMASISPSDGSDCIAASCAPGRRAPISASRRS